MRVVSLVPSLTETLFELGLRDEELVGRTSWCIHPADRVASAPKLGGTKTPNVERIIALRPDLVVMEKEENPLDAWRRFQDAGVTTFVAHVTSVADVGPMLTELGRALGRSDRGAELAAELADVQQAAPAVGPVVVPLIWNDPLMAVSPTRYSGDLLRAAGLVVPDIPSRTGYPEVDPDLLGRLGVEHLLLTSEPHRFTLEEGEAVAEAMAAAGHARPRCRLVDGEGLTWFGARTARALPYWQRLRVELAEASGHTG